MKCCAICADGPTETVERPLGRGDAMVPVCLECDEGPIVAKGPSSRGYEPTGGMLTREESDAGARRVLGDAEYERLRDLEIKNGQRPRVALTRDERILREYDLETNRMHRTGAFDTVSTKARRSSRTKSIH